MRKILAFLCISAGLASATQIKSVTYNGLIHLSTKSAEEVSGLHVGGEINDKIANKAILNLYKQGYFKDIYIDEKDGAVSVNLTEKPVIAKIDIENIVTNDRKALVEQVLGIKKGQMYDKKGINLAKERIVQFYQAKGFFDCIFLGTSSLIYCSRNFCPTCSKRNGFVGMVPRKNSKFGKVLFHRFPDDG